MKILVFLLIAGKLITVVPPQSVTVPDVDEVFAQTYYHQSMIVYAHSYLAGGYFYDIKPGEKVVALYSDGSLKSFTAVENEIYIARSTDDAQTGENFEVTDGIEWMKLSDAMNRYSEPGGIILFTCYAADQGHAMATGRLFVELAPEVLEDKEKLTTYTFTSQNKKLSVLR